MTFKKRIIKDTIQYSIANYTATAIGVVVSVMTKAILGTVGAGLWAIMKVFNSYGEYSDLGTRDALLREIPQLIGAREMDKCEKIQNSAFSFSMLSALFSAAAFLIMAVFVIREQALKHGVIVVAFLVIATQMYNYFLTLLRTLKKVR